MCKIIKFEQALRIYLSHVDIRALILSLAPASTYGYTLILIQPMLSENSKSETYKKAIHERAFDRLAELIKRTDIRINKGTEAVTGTFTVKSDEEYVAIKLLLDLANIDPWDNAENRTLSIGRYDIELLIELGILDASTLSSTEREDMSEGFDDEVTKKLAEGGSLESIPKLFEPKAKTQSPFTNMSEQKDGEEEYFSYGNTSYLYNIYKRKYRREFGGKVFKKTRIGDEIVETEISPEEQEKLLKKAQGGDEKARNEYLIMNIGLVYLVALNLNRQYPRTNLSDLLQEALIRMNQCIDKYQNRKDDTEVMHQYDEEQLVSEQNNFVSRDNDTLVSKPIEISYKNAKFSTYAVKSMQLGLLRYIGSERLIHIPANMLDSFGKIQKIITALEKEKFSTPGRRSIVARIAYDMILSTKKAEELYDLYQTFRSEKIHDINAIEELGEDIHLVDESQNPAYNVLNSESKTLVNQILGGLEPEEREILALRHGHNEYTQEDAGKILNISKAQIRQKEAHIFRKLRHPSRSDVLRPLQDNDMETRPHPFFDQEFHKSHYDTPISRLEKDRRLIQKQFDLVETPADIAFLAEEWLELYDNLLTKFSNSREHAEDYRYILLRKKTLFQVIIQRILTRSQVTPKNILPPLTNLLHKYTDLQHEADVALQALPS